ncbi:hypothetical protein [Streptomyces chartreusis]|uniref:Uncharacterized protein n=1 Tax=Streptomyces chartreusis TaxID=1969 RepID=A0A7H8TIC5_STRCX|nr:hypothetical protein [Streptomyces chartreusis]QKZ23286.1 hypothetical protein HUT05_41575 [Streptomyces chartreusis]
MGKKSSTNATGAEYRERRLVITTRSQRGKRTIQVVVDDHLALSLSVSTPLFLALVFLFIAAAYYLSATAFPF